jgi:hypothetical protein
MRQSWISSITAALLAVVLTGWTGEAQTPREDPGFFPLAVWLQSPANAAAYRRAGINTYVGLWKGPTEEQLAALRTAGMKVVCHQNETGLRHHDDPTIMAWMHDDEPDNAQSLGAGQGYGPPVAVGQVVAEYQRMRAADSSRPVLLNLGQGVAWDRYIGRGVRRNHPEDYPEYLKGCDIASFDIYPAVHEDPEVAGNLTFVARGVERLIQWSEGRKTIWNCLECTRIGNPDRKPAPREVRAEAWMSIIHGSRGLIYFVHQFKPVFREAALLDDPEMLQAVTALNRQITELAPVLNGPTRKGLASVEVPGEAAAPVAIMARQRDESIHLFAVAMRNAPVSSARFVIQGTGQSGQIDVLGEDRRLSMVDGGFTDDFDPWGVHIYRIRVPRTDR